MHRHPLFRSCLLLLLLSSLLPADQRMFQMQDRWALSVHSSLAIERPGYDYAPAVLKEENGYRMWWCGSAPSGDPFVDHIWTAESADGLQWKHYQVALAPRASELICDPSVVRVGGSYYMYFTATRDLMGGTNNEIHLAKSTDGVRWTRQPSDQDPQPVIALPELTTSYGIGQPSVLYRGSRFWVYYTDTTREEGGTFLASSADGVHFTMENSGHRLVATNSVDVKYCVPLRLFIMICQRNHDRLFVSQSSDGIRWAELQEDRYLAPATGKNKAFEGGMAGTADGSIDMWTFYYFASHQGTPGAIQDPLSWNIEVGRLSLSAIPAAGTVYRFVAPAIPSRDHFYDTRMATPSQYNYENRAFAVSEAPRPGWVPFFRMYQPRLQDHFYTADPNEKQNALALGFRDEGILGYVASTAQPGTVSLMRLYHPRGDHFYTVDASERDRFLSDGYRDEGISAWVWPADRSGRPAVPRILSLGFLGSTLRIIRINYDASVVAGAFDVRLDISEPNVPFGSSRETVAAPEARVVQRFIGNAAQVDYSVESYPPGTYYVRIQALDEAGLPLGSTSDSAAFTIGPPAPLDAPPFGYIDVPTAGTVTNGFLAVEGWALDDRQVTQVEVLVDGRSVGTAVRGRSRPDVAQVFPTYPNGATSGFRLETNISSLPVGEHRIEVEITDSSYQKTIIGPRLIQLTGGGNMAPFGFLDLPAVGAVVGGNALEIGGWALDDRGVSRVEVWLDGESKGLMTYGIFRPDVAAVFPGFANNPNSGFTGLLDLRFVTAGFHRLQIRVYDLQGLFTNFPVRDFLRQ